MARQSLSKDRIKVLLLEGIHENAVADFAADGYMSTERLPKALAEDDLVRRIRGVHMLGIRSRTQLTRRVLESADKLMAVGCFCIGTNQVDLDAARGLGVPVFNAPYSNTRSVAELVMGEVIMLMRGIFDKSALAHQGGWQKSATGSSEVRGKTLGIVGYGHIGTQVGVLAEALGMRVRFFDTGKKLALGNAVPCASLDELLSVSDVVTLHVPETPQTAGMIDRVRIARMREGGFLINASRGTVVDIEALADALKSGYLRGAAVDVFPREPQSDGERFESALQGLPNTILTPHIGGSTQEAQAAIGNEVAGKLIDYSDVGSTIGAVNFPQVQLPVRSSGTRFLHIHRNVPGVLRRLNEVFTGRDYNIAAQYLQTDGEIGYVVVDLDAHVDDPAIIEEMRAIEGTLRARFLYDR